MRSIVFGGLVAVSTAGQASDIAADARLHKAAVIGTDDERLGGAFFGPRINGDAYAGLYLSRALRIWFPHPGSMVVTGTPVCFPDIVVTAAHVYVNIGDGTAKPKGLRVSIPDLERPGKFLRTLTVKDYMLSSLQRGYNANEVPEVRNDFLALLLSKPLPPYIVPLSLHPFGEVAAMDGPLACANPTVNAAYHADLGIAGKEVVSIANRAAHQQVTATGKVPLMTVSTRFTDKFSEGEKYGSWYTDPLVVFPEHDTHESASGSAMVCPTKTDRGGIRDYLHGIMIGQMYFGDEAVDVSGKQRAINVATVNLADMYRAIARLKGVDVDTLHEQCEPFIRKALNEIYPG